MQYLICNIWYAISDLRYLICNIWYAIFVLQYLICDIWFAIYDISAEQGEGGSLEILCLTTVMEQVGLAIVMIVYEGENIILIPILDLDYQCHGAGAVAIVMIVAITLITFSYEGENNGYGNIAILVWFCDTDPNLRSWSWLREGLRSNEIQLELR